jgi:hypothetical protein
LTGYQADGDSLQPYFFTIREILLCMESIMDDDRIKRHSYDIIELHPAEGDMNDLQSDQQFQAAIEVQ